MMLHFSENDVLAFLNANQARYISLIVDLEALLKNELHRAGHGHRVFRIYSRAEKQNGNALKDPLKVRDALNVLIGKGSNPKIEEVSDIAAMTIVVRFPSDVQVLCAVLDHAIDKQVLISRDSKGARGFGIDKSKKGYYAYHYDLSLPGGSSDLTCEVQIKTVLHDAWAAKTHDLSYKHPGVVDERLVKNIEILGDTLAAIDNQSEYIKELLEERWLVEREKKKTAVSSILFLSSAQPVADDANGSVLTEMREGLDNLEKRAAVHGKPLNDGLVSDYLHKINGMASGDGFSRSAFLGMLLLAFSVDTEECREHAIRRIRGWVEGRKLQGWQEFQARTSLGLAYFYFGRLVEAISSTEKAIENLKSTPDLQLDAKQLFLYAKSFADLAYYRADSIGAHGSDSLDEIRKKSLEDMKYAKKHLKESQDAFKLVQGEGAANFTDSLRALELEIYDNEAGISVACASTAQGARDGLNRCREIYLKKVAAAGQDSEASEEAQHIYRVHEISAMRRILDLEHKAL